MRALRPRRRGAGSEDSPQTKKASVCQLPCRIRFIASFVSESYVFADCINYAAYYNTNSSRATFARLYQHRDSRCPGHQPSGQLPANRPPFAALIDYLARDHFLLLTSPELLAELDRVVRYEKLQRSYTDEERTRFVALVVALGEVGDLPVAIPRMCRDSDDDRLIACAVVGSLSRLLPTVA